MNNIPTNNKKVLKTGPVTLALTLIITGICMLLINFAGIENFSTLWKFWPLLLVGLGVEYFIRKLTHKNMDIRFSVGSIFAIFPLIIVGSMINFFANINITEMDDLDDILSGEAFEPPSVSTHWKSEPVVMPSGTQLTVEHSNGKVELISSSDNKFRASALLRVNNIEKEDMNYMNENDIFFPAEMPNLIQEGSYNKLICPQGRWAGHAVTTDLTLEIPKDIEVKINSNNGRFDISKIKSSTTIDVTDGYINVENSSGDIKLKSRNARINIKNHSGSLAAETVNGSIDFESDIPVNRQYNLNSINGSVDFTIPENSDITINASSVNGHVKINHDSGTKKESLTLGDGRGTSQLEVKNGTVDIETR